MAGRVLTVAESDSSGGSGIQADIKTILALGGYATTAVTGITAQNTREIKSFQTIDPLMVADQMRAVMQDIGTDAIKTGVLNSEIIVDAVADVLDECQNDDIFVVIDPSLVSHTGEILVDDGTIAAIKRRLLIRAHMLTPNVKEAEHLTGMTLHDLDDMRHAASMLRSLGVETVVLKCGPVLSNKELYLIAYEGGERIYERPQVNTQHTLGAGATLASALAVSMAQGLPLFPAVERALEFLHQAMQHAPGYGAGRGPMNHAFLIERQEAFFHTSHVKVREV